MVVAVVAVVVVFVFMVAVVILAVMRAGWKKVVLAVDVVVVPCTVKKAVMSLWLLWRGCRGRCGRCGRRASCLCCGSCGMHEGRAMWWLSLAMWQLWHA